MFAVSNKVPVNLSSGPGTFSIRGTSGLQTLVELYPKSGGKPFDCTGWTIALWYGPSLDEGHAVVATAVGRGYVRFELSSADTATTGRLYAQVLASYDGGDEEEWLRGWFSLSPDPSVAYDPLEWDSYLDEAPDDGRTYGRKEGEWVEIPASAGVADIEYLPVGGTVSLYAIRATVNELLAALKGDA